jgi:hypothetical protein
MYSISFKFFYILQIKIIYFILLSLFCSSCLSIKPSKTKSGKNYFETFYVGEQGTQYFIKPISFVNKKSDEELILDFTFRYKNKIKDSSIINFSIKSANIYKSIDSLKILNKNIEIKNNKVMLLFNEKKSDGFISRHTTKVNLLEVKELFNNGDWKVIIYNQNQIREYIPEKKTIKIINIMKDKIFSIM